MYVLNSKNEVIDSMLYGPSLGKLGFTHLSSRKPGDRQKQLPLYTRLTPKSAVQQHQPPPHTLQESTLMLYNRTCTSPPHPDEPALRIIYLDLRNKLPKRKITDE